MRIGLLALKLLVLAGTLSCQGCTSVSPWERGNLAKEEMALDPNPKLNHLRDHIFTSREASQGGLTGNGGGCGCN
jgi:hypothetical protein